MPDRLKRILLVEDEYSVATIIRRGLVEEGYDVTVAGDGATGLGFLENQAFDLIMLDVILPGMNGMEVCREIRRRGFRDLPILMLTALGSTEDIVDGLEVGADDYMLKPFKFQELFARIKALLRRKSGSTIHENTLEIGDLVMDLNSKMVLRGNKEIRLTSTEFKLLHYFLKNQKKVLDRMSILENVWDINFDLSTNVVDVYVNYLRNKIEKGFDSKLIHTVIGMGYIMREQEHSHEN